MRSVHAYIDIKPICGVFYNCHFILAFEPCDSTSINRQTRGLILKEYTIQTAPLPPTKLPPSNSYGEAYPANDTTLQMLDFDKRSESGPDRYSFAPEVLLADAYQRDDPKVLCSPHSACSTATSQGVPQSPSNSNADGHLANDTIPHELAFEVTHNAVEIIPQSNKDMTELEAKDVEGENVTLIKKVEGSTYNAVEIIPQSNKEMTELEAKDVEGGNVTLIKKVEGSTYNAVEIIPQSNKDVTELEAKDVEERKVALIKSSIKFEGSNSITGRVLVSKDEGCKQVWIRWSDDEWSHVQDTKSEQIDSNTFTFRFTIVRGRKVELAVKYMLNDQEYWDNNDGKNFMVCTD
ncbi:hypothetical protein EMCRGX_G005178 [Ephydatia muelleri]